MSEIEELEAPLFFKMADQLKLDSDRLAFIQSRTAAEFFVRDECAFAAEQLLLDRPYRVLMELKIGDKKVDLVIVPVYDDKPVYDEALIYELKMAWPGTLEKNCRWVKQDLERLQATRHGWSLVLFFSLSSGPKWLPYVRECSSFDDRVAEFIDCMGTAPTLKGSAFGMCYGDVAGRAQLLAWRASDWSA